MWFIVSSTPGRFIARATVEGCRNGHQEGDNLVTNVLDEIRVMLPTGPTRRDRAMMVADVVET
ncbi:MAG: hypothetical protein EOO77_16695 [Oxalobacteraceae bacterium]|nr:MAG: hypothetical protein EOO77_16695 [Oxalobacteraceae bacterium]